jgi:hypothetical protein
MKAPIGYGADVSASRSARLVGDETSTWTYSLLVDLSGVSKGLGNDVGGKLESTAQGPPKARVEHDRDRRR